MSDAYVRVAPDSTGKKIETSELIRPDLASDATTAWQTVERQRVDVGDDPDLPQQQTRILHEILVELQHLRLALLDALH